MRYRGDAAGRMETLRVRIAVIDSGINGMHQHVCGRGAIVHLINLAGGEEADVLGHGTAVAAAILDLAPGNEIYSIRIFDRDLTCPSWRLLAAIDQALRSGAELCNLSLGTTAPEEAIALEERVAAARAQGMRIVAPASWSGRPSYPGVLPGADGVIADPNVPRDAPVRREEEGRAWWFASPLPRAIPGVRPQANLSGVSFATANVTGHLARRRSP